MARNGARSPLQKNPDQTVSDKDHPPSPTSSSSSTSTNHRSWKLAGSTKKPEIEEVEAVPNTEEPNSKSSSSRHLLLLLRRHSTLLRHRPPLNRRDFRSCCFCCFCCCTCSCTNSKKKLSKGAGEALTATTGTEAAAEPKPSLEEIRSWGESFDSLMKCAAGRELFREFLQCEYSEENILFWCACEDLKRELNPEVIEEKARMIYEDFVSILSPREVSLDSKVREIVNLKMARPTANTFDEAQLQIYTLMHRDSYPRFLGSSVYRRMAQLSPATRKTSVSVH